MDFSEWVLYLTISVRITFCTSCPYDEFFLLSRIVHSGKSKSLCSLLKWLGFYPCLSIVTRRCDVCPHPLVIGMTDINLQPSELCSLILSCNSISPSSTFGFICFLSWNLTLKVLYSYELAMYVAFVGDLFTHLWYELSNRTILKDSSLYPFEHNCCSERFCVGRSHRYRLIG